MSVPPDQLQAVMGGGMPQGMPNPPAGAAPIGSPESPQGTNLAASAKVKIAMKMLMAAVAEFDPTSKEGGTVYSCLQKLQKQFGQEKSDDLVPAELSMLQGGMSPPPQLAAMAGGGGPPGMMPGMPPGMPM